MEFVQSGLSLSFEVTFDDPTLSVAMKVYDDSGVSPSLVSTTAMSNFFGNSYRAKFTALASKSYLIHKAVYTDGTFTTLDSNYAAGTESVRSDDLAGILLNALLSSYVNIGSVGEAIQKASLGVSGGTVVEGVVTTSLVLGLTVVPEPIVDGEITNSNIIVGEILSCGA